MLCKAKFKAVNAERIGLNENISQYENAAITKSIIKEYMIGDDFIITLTDGRKFYIDEDLFNALFEVGNVG